MNTCRQIEPTELLTQAYQAYAPGIRSYLRGRLRSQELAEDLAQEVFLRATRAIRGGGAWHPTTLQEYPGWLQRIAANLLIDTVRRARCLTWCPLDDTGTTSTSWGIDPADRYTQNELMQTVLARLSPGQRQALLLRYIHGLEASEIAHVLGIEQRAARIRVSRARQAFIACYAQEVRP